MTRLDQVIFDKLVHQQSLSPVNEKLNMEDMLPFQAYTSLPLQSPLTAKNLALARRIASYILQENGDIDLRKVTECIHGLSQSLYPISPDLYEETPSREHLLRMLQAIKNTPQIQASLKRLFLPSYTEVIRLIRNTLALPEQETLTITHVRQAVLVALFSYLRQDVSSCFASAVAILIHQEYPHLFIKDMEDLLSLGKLTRIVGTKEVSVPFNLSPSIGELFKPIRVMDFYPNPLTSLSTSPGLQKACLAAGLIQPLEDPQERLQELLSHEFLMEVCQQPYETITVQKILQSTLLHYYGISLNQVSSFLLQEGMRNKDAVLLNYDSTANQSTRQRVCSYLHAYEQAIAAFTSDTQNPLLKAWEYTLATLADANNPSTLHHLQTALGWDASQTDGLHELMLAFVQEEITLAQEHASKCEHTYQEAQAQLAYVESRMRSPLNAQDSQILSMDHIRFRQELNQALYDWNVAQEKIKKLLSLPNFFLSFYAKTLPLYFKSSYDAFIQEFSTHYADSPAGFRILFTHGRSHPNTWTPIYSLQEFIQALAEFFSSTEEDLMSKHGVVGVEQEASVLVHRMITALHTHRFQEATITRILQAYQEPLPVDPLNHLSQITHTPWVYVSGGNPSTLITYYFEQTEPITLQKKHPENAHELAAFFTDALKDLPVGIKQYLNENQHNLLASSPSHVFSVIAGSPLFLQAWENDWYSYTWLRDIWIKQNQDFVHDSLLSQSEIYQFINSFCQRNHIEHLSSDFHTFCSNLSLSLPELYEKASHFFATSISGDPVVQTLFQNRLAQHLIEETPYTNEQQLPITLENIFSYLGISSRMAFEKLQPLIESYVPKMALISSRELYQLCLGLLMHSYEKFYMGEDLALRLITAMRYHKLSYPAPLLFGDSNWAQTYFGFILHPGTKDIDLWAFNSIGLKGRPIDNMTISVQQPWSLYTNPIDYGMPPPPGYRSHMPKGFF